MVETRGAAHLLDVAATSLRSVTTPLGDQARALQAARDAADAALVEILAEMYETGAHEAEGASSVSTWAARELRQDRSRTRQLVQAEATFTALPEVAEAARAGRITVEHVRSFTYALRHLDRELAIDFAPTFLEIALTHSPSEFHAKVREVREIFHADELDRAWIRGMAKYDVRIVRVGDDYQLAGNLPPDLGAKVQVLLDSLSVPREEGDDRTAAERRLHGLTDLVDGILEHGLPQDGGIRPHLHVILDEEGPAHLEGFGPIGPKLAGMITCDSELTPYLADPRGDVKDVGRSSRTATPGQKKLIRLRQMGRCQSPGCGHTIRHYHHVEWWSRGGLTETEVMVGLCHKCHILIHQEQLFVFGTHTEGFRFTTHRNGALARAG